MAANRLYTIRDVARELALPESTVRYYRNAFAAHLPSVGTGRRRRYPAEAVPLLRMIAEGYAQNRPRSEIEQALSDSQGSVATAKARTAVAARGFGDDPQRDELLATVLDGERDRREVMWQMARELVRLGEAIERQQVMLSKLVESLTTAFPAGADWPAGAGELGLTSAAEGSAAGGRESPLRVGSELEELRKELARERELVERLRRSKLEIERRAAEAEARLGGGSSGDGPSRRGLIGRLLTREDEPHR